MGQLVPAALPQAAFVPGLERELETLEQLKRRLPATLSVFHGVHWSRAWTYGTAFGEADFIVVNGAGRCLVIEQKTGSLEEGKDGLQKRYDGKAKSVGSQLHRTLDALRDKFKAQSGHQIELDYLLYLPDYRVRDLCGAGLDQNRIVDGRNAVRLCERIIELLGETDATPHGGRVLRFFEQSLDLVPDIHSRVGLSERCYTRAVGGLADIVGAISARPLRLAVRGTAGCGKSLVAIRAFRAAEAAGKRPLLLCFNRDLKEKMKVAAGQTGGVVETFHGAIDRVLKDTGRPLAHEAGGVDWNRAVDQVLEGEIPDSWRFDTVIVDEGQDFTPAWREMLDLFGADTGDCLWLDDPDQAIQYGTSPDSEAWPRGGWTGFRAKSNFRTPASIARFLQRLLPGFEFLNANPLPGLGVGITEVPGKSEVSAAVGRVSSELMKKGFAREQIVALSLRGQQSATLGQCERAGSQTIARFTGNYDMFGNQLWTNGHLRFDTIRRYKGQQDAAVIVTDVEMPDEEERRGEWERLLFAALTRATERLELVVTRGSKASRLLHDAW
ncbi:ATP-binding domain-containing protein [Sphingomonas sp. LHG3406-1]|uniref:nuclease-related domain-containing DEAD/DEAH box helicase n=1 Tax=Sphingomonas sp. LHG3406-1 TaxID=2804617 RepID=UPI0026218E0F|nr:ATP-binding domain-containing protein [Sphingomonas sp. LHG3406-1]